MFDNKDAYNKYTVIISDYDNEIAIAVMITVKDDGRY